MATSTPTGYGASSIRWISEVTSPFKSLSRRIYPNTIWETLLWGNELWMHHGIYSQAITKAVRYFLTEIEIFDKAGELTESIRSKFDKVLTDQYDLMTLCGNIGDDFLAFGNSFTSLHAPFERNLICPKCAFRAPLKRYSYNWRNYKFHAKCPGTNCSYEGPMDIKDLRMSGDEMRPVVIRWPPQLMQIQYHPTSGRKKYYLDTPKYMEFAEGLKKGNPLYLEDTPWELVEAIRDNAVLEFEDDYIYHMANISTAYSGPVFRGWGIPKFMSEFETVILIVMLDKYNEMILTDYLMPFRLISPPSGRGASDQASQDPMLNVGLGNFIAQVRKMLEEHRKNPTGWNFVPFPVQYQALGGEGRDLAPVEMMEHFEMRLLNSMGIPQEMYSGSMNSSTAPIIAFKMFERTWQHFGKELDKWLTWFVQKQGELRKWEKVSARLVPVSLYEDPDVRQVKMDLAASNQISKATAFRMLGLNAKEEQNKVIAEQEEQEELLQDKQIQRNKDQANLQVMYTPSPGEQIIQGQQMQQGGAPAPSANMPTSPLSGSPAVQGDASVSDLDNQGDQLAQQILTMEPSQRRSQLISLKKTNDTLHAIVTGKLKTLEQQAGQTGVNLTRQGQIPPGGQQQQ